MGIDRLTERYHHDNAWHALVDSLRALIETMQLAPSEIREAAMFAAYLTEMRNPKPITITIDKDACPYCFHKLGSTACQRLHP